MHFNVYTAPINLFSLCWPSSINNVHSALLIAYQGLCSGQWHWYLNYQGNLATPSNLDSLTTGDLTPTGYQLHHVTRDTRGGGVGLLHKSSLSFHMDSANSIGHFQPFEAANIQLHWHSNTTHILIIYPPSIIKLYCFWVNLAVYSNIAPWHLACWWSLVISTFM